MSFVEHPEFHLPPGETSIWRYLDFTKLLSLLETNALYFASMETIARSDPFEGLYTRANLTAEKIPFEAFPEEFRKQSPAYADKWTYENVVVRGSQSAREFTKKMRAITFVNCWHISKYEPAAMWKAYLKSDEGVAIRSTVQRLKDSIANYSDFEVLIGAVSYIDFDSQMIPMTNLVLPSIHKRRSFEHERELRAVIWGMQHGKMALGSNSIPSGLKAAVDLDVLVESIYAAPAAGAWFAELLRSVCSRYNLKKQVIQSDLSSQSLY
jgi:hypothetical protein